MLDLTIKRAFKVLKLEKNSYREISKDPSAFFQSAIIIILAALLNIFLFNKYVNPRLPMEIPLAPLFFLWLFFNWYLFSRILNYLASIFYFRQSGKKVKHKVNVALGLVGFSYTAEILKILIIFSPNFIRVISWSALMLVAASQIIGVKEIYKIEKISTSIGVVILSYIVQILFLVGIVILFSILGS